MQINIETSTTTVECPKILTSLWKCWDEGADVEGIGRKPPLWMVEAEWGSRKDKWSNKGHHAAWCPHQNTTVYLHLHYSPLAQH